MGNPENAEINLKSTQENTAKSINQSIPISHLLHSTYMAHLLDSISLCLQRPEESIQVAVERHFPTILAQLGPSVIGQSHAEKAEELFKTAIANLEMGGARNRWVKEREKKRGEFN